MSNKETQINMKTLKSLFDLFTLVLIFSSCQKHEMGFPLGEYKYDMVEYLNKYPELPNDNYEQYNSPRGFINLNFGWNTLTQKVCKIDLKFEKNKLICSGSFPLSFDQSGNLFSEDFTEVSDITYGDGYFTTESHWLWVYIRSFGNTYYGKSYSEFAFVENAETDPNDPVRYLESSRDLLYHYYVSDNGDIHIDALNRATYDTYSVVLKKN